MAKDDAQTTMTRALATTLEKLGKKFQAAVLLVQVEDLTAVNGTTIMGSMTGNHDIIGSMIYQQLRRMISEPITVTPWGTPDPNERPVPAKDN
jgi:DNA-directed RNA polymerase specialized sigma24 family protein